MNVRLKDVSGMFYDPQTGFGLIADEIKPLPSVLGDLTRRWLNAGGLVKIAHSTPKEVEDEAPISSDVQPRQDGTTEYMSQFSRSELMRLAKKRGIPVARSDRAQDIARKLAEADIGS